MQHTYIHVRTYVQSYVHTVLRMYSPTYVQSYVCTVLRTYSPTYVQSYVRTVLRTYSPTYVQSYVRTVLRMYSPTYVQSYVCTVLRTYSPTYVLSSELQMDPSQAKLHYALKFIQLKVILGSAVITRKNHLTALNIVQGDLVKNILQTHFPIRQTVLSSPCFHCCYVHE